MSNDVIIVGAAGVDTLVYLPDAEPDFSVDSTMVHTVDAVGQAGAFTARGFARLGWRTGFIGALGRDWAADAVRRAFAVDGVRIVAESIDAAGTARSVNLMTPDGRRRAFYDGRGHFDVAPPPGAEAALAAGYRLAVFHLSNWCRRLLPVERAPGALVATDLQDVGDPNDPYRTDFVAAADVLFASATHLADPRAAARVWLGRFDRAARRGPRLVVFGLGSEGALAVTSQLTVHVPVPALELPVVDTNGAGDGLATGVLDWLLRHAVADAAEPLESLAESDLRDALVNGQLLARWTSQLRGSEGLASRNDLVGMWAQIPHV